jgi:sigma-E factor negative regulatory protein RseC
MVEETGTVTKVHGEMAKVLVPKKTACEGCSVEGACESTAEGMEIDAFNPVHAREGQRVRVHMAPREYLKGSLLVYGFPLVLFIAGTIVGKIIGDNHFREANSDLIAAITGFMLLVLSLACVRMWSKKMETGSGHRPVIEEIVNE